MQTLFGRKNVTFLEWNPVMYASEFCKYMLCYLYLNLFNDVVIMYYVGFLFFSQEIIRIKYAIFCLYTRIDMKYVLEKKSISY